MELYDDNGRELDCIKGKFEKEEPEHVVEIKMWKEDIEKLSYMCSL